MLISIHFHLESIIAKIEVTEILQRNSSEQDNQDPEMVSNKSNIINPELAAGSHEVSAPVDVSHLGELIGDLDSDRIVAVATSAVFNDRSLTRNFWGIDDRTLDSGFQGHIYTRQNDILVVQVPGCDNVIPRMVMTAIGVNCEIWKSLTGIRILSSSGQIVLTSIDPCQPPDCLPENFTWYKGGLLDAAVTRYQNTGESFLAFVLSTHIANKLGLDYPDDGSLMDQARTRSLLMDKDTSMRILQRHGVDCARTYIFNEGSDIDVALNSIPSTGNYVFNPAGGAAGIGLFSSDNQGASHNQIRSHLNSLRRKHQLPTRFQIQEFIAGPPHGVTTSFKKDGSFEILEIHQQYINETGRFIGGRWTAALQDECMRFANAVSRQLAAIKDPRLSGLICLDFIDGKIIEVNPRLTASAPIVHILRQKDRIAQRIGGEFRIEQIDLNTNVPIPYDAIENGTLHGLINVIWKEFGALVLPQGLNPFGSSRCVFINDNSLGTAQQTFIQQITI